MMHVGRPVPHARLLAALRGPGFGDERAYLRVLIGQLRKKLEDDAANPTYLLTDSYIGYRFREPQLFVSESHDGIDTHSFPGRYVRREQRDSQKQQRDAGE